MFAALFPKQMSVQPRNFPGQVIEPDSALDLTSDLPLARLRFGQRMSLMVPLTDHSYLGLSDFYKPNGPPEYTASSDPTTEDVSTKFGVPIRGEVPNVLKTTPLDWNTKPLQIPIPLAGIKTVEGLVQRIGHQSHLEFYADARWEKTPVTLSGAAPTATGRDLLQALALCLTGTYRPVGPAFVLTADQVGDGTREQIWDEFAEQVGQAGADQINQAAQQLGTAHSPRELSWYGDSLAYSPEQLQKTDPDFPRLEDLPFAQLTPAQQTAIRGLAAQMVNDTIPGQGGKALQVDLAGKFSLEARPQVQVIVPSLASPITMYDLSRNLYVMGNIFDPSKEDHMAQLHQILAKQNAPSPAVSIPDLTTRLAAVPRRAVLAYPHTAADVDALVTSMKTIGLNQLWLVVFSTGASSVPGTPLASTAPMPPGTNDILTEALAATKGTDIQVFPVLNLLSWGQATPTKDRDRTLRGEDTLQDDVRLEKRDSYILGQIKSEADMGAAFYSPLQEFRSVRVSPFAADVQQSLAALIKTLAARSGVAGLIWQDTVSPGYDVPIGEPHDRIGDQYRTPLGYTETARLAFLRLAHVDPLDISRTWYGGSDPNVSLFGNDGQNQTLRLQWNRFRANADVHFLQTLYQSAQATPVGKPLILIRQRRDYDSDSPRTLLWFGSWDSPRQPLPAFHRAGEDMQHGEAWPEQQDALTQAKAQSQVALIRLAPRTLPTAAWLLGQLKKLPQGKSWDGFVLDLTPRVVFGTFTGISTTEHDPLRRLADDMTPQKNMP
jgi:hypothetical protein